jgi:D-alanine-D-alanine ligase
VSPADHHSLDTEDRDPLVIVLSGGTSTERDVSLQSGEAVMEALRASIETGALKAKLEAITIEVDGRWRWRGNATDEQDSISSLPASCIVFNALHGGRGEGGGVQRALDKAGILYTGSGPDASALCMNKSTARVALAQAGLHCARGELISSLPEEARDLSALTEQLLDLSSDGHGWFVKPNEGGSSAGVQKVTSVEDLLPAIRLVLMSGEEALVEAAVVGVELSAGVLGGSHNDLTAFTPVEIQPRSAGWFDIAEKYDDENGAREACPPESVSAEVIHELKSAALIAHRATGCHGYSRTDFIYSSAGELIALEVNTLPGLTPRSLLPLEAAEDGVSFPELCMSVLSFAALR